MRLLRRPRLQPQLFMFADSLGCEEAEKFGGAVHSLVAPPQPANVLRQHLSLQLLAVSWSEFKCRKLN